MGNMNGRNSGIVDKEFLIEFVPICENTMFFDEKYIFGQQIENVMCSNNIALTGNWELLLMASARAARR